MNAKQVRLLEISTRHTVTEVFAGEYSSAFKGRGMEFAEVREYQPGDDVRTIDWNVTARTNKPFVKRFTEERELTASQIAAQQAGEKAVGAGKLSAAQVAELTFEAVRENRFYVLPHPRILPAVELRMQDILAQRNPSDPFSFKPEVVQRPA